MNSGLIKSVSMRKPGRTRQGVIMLKLFKVDFESILRRLNGLFWCFVLENTTSCKTSSNVPIREVLHDLK